MSQPPPPPPLSQAPLPAQPGGEELQKPRRPRRLLERPLPWLVGAVATFLVLFGIAFLIFNSIKNGGGASGRGAFSLILFFGILALLLILATSFYSLRKRRRSFQEGMPGTMMAWFKAHVWLGLLAFGAVIIHVLTRPISSDLSTGKLALIVFFLLVLSGVGWRLVYRRVPRSVSEEVGNLAVSDTQRRLDEVQVEIDKLSAGRSDHFQTLVAARLRGVPQPELDQQALALPEEERAVWVHISRLAYDRERYLARVGRQQKLARFMQGWRVAHWPLAAILFALVFVHILDVFGAGRAAFGGAATQFPSSESCANCHSQIANDWKQSVMSHGATSPIMIAQVQLAVQKNIENGTPLGTICTACHGPIGVELTGAEVLPFPGTDASSDPNATGKRNRVLAEGVTCVVCHALDAAPPPGSGAFGMPVNKSGLSSLGKVTGPILPGGPPIPVPDHQTIVGGYMADEVTSSELCGACHVVAVDLNQDGNIDRNAVAGQQPDLVLQTTYLEWLEDYQSQPQFAGVGCVTCHAPPTPGPIVDAGPFLGSVPDRLVHNHAFVGVDYDLTPGHPGLSEEEFEEVLEEREVLLRTAAVVDVQPQVQGQFLTANVTVRNVGAGHTLPTGFAFVRQMWLEVRATNLTTGQPLCLAGVVFSDGGQELAAQCASGVIENDREDLRYCDPNQIANQVDPNFVHDNLGIQLAPGASRPPGECDPWLASWQKILTDGPPGQRSVEVAFQSLEPDIVANRARIFDNLVMAALQEPGLQGDSLTVPYQFFVGDIAGSNIEIEVRLRFRHASAYFLRALDGLYPNGLTANDLIQNLTVVDMLAEPARAQIAV